MVNESQNQKHKSEQVTANQAVLVFHALVRKQHLRVLLLINN